MKTSRSPRTVNRTWTPKVKRIDVKEWDFQTPMVEVLRSNLEGAKAMGKLRKSAANNELIQIQSFYIIVKRNQISH